VAQNAILLFLPVKFNFCRKKVWNGWTQSRQTLCTGSLYQF